MYFEADKLEIGFFKRKDEHILINDFTYRFENNGLYVISGISGIGKSYLLGTLYGSHKPINGEIKFNGESIKKHRVYEKYIKNIFFLTTQGLLINELKIKDNISLFGVNPKKLDLDGFNNVDNLIFEKYPNEISKGQSKIIELLIALNSERKILFLDEPLAGIDVDNFDKCLNLIENAKKDKIIVLVTHEMIKTSKVSDIIFEIENQNINVIKKNEIDEKNVHEAPMMMREKGVYKYIFKTLLSKIRFILNDFLILLVASLTLSFLGLLLNFKLVYNFVDEEVLSTLDAFIVIFLMLFLVFLLVDAILFFTFARYRYLKEYRLNYVFKQVNLNKFDKILITSIQLLPSFIFMNALYFVITLPVFIELPQTMNEDLYKYIYSFDKGTLSLGLVYLIFISLFLIIFAFYHFIYIKKKAKIALEVN